MLFAWLIYQSDPARIWHYLSKVNPWIPLLALPVSWVALFLKSLRWRSLLLHEDQNLSLGQAFIFYAGGNFWGSVTPGKMGELAKAKYLKDRGIPYTHGIASIFVDRLLEVCLLSCVAIAPLLVLLEMPWVRGNEALLLCTFLICLALGAIGLGFFSKETDIGSKGSPPSFKSHLFIAAQWIRKVPARAWLVAFGLGAVATFMFLFQRIILAWSLELNGDPFFYAGAIAAAALLSALPNTLQGVGTRDAALVYILGRIEVPAEAALALSQLILLVMIVNTGLSRLVFLKGKRLLHDQDALTQSK